MYRYQREEPGIDALELLDCNRFSELLVAHTHIAHKFLKGEAIIINISQRT
jgi:hypothetical protein